MDKVELIDRVAAAKDIIRLAILKDSKDTNELTYILGYNEAVLHAKNLILSAPTIDAAPVRRGEWKYFHKQNRAVCTQCSFERNLDTDFGAAVSCPNCGADMRGKSE